MFDDRWNNNFSKGGQVMEEVKIKGMMVKTVGEAMEIWKKHYILDSFFIDDSIVMFFVD